MNRMNQATFISTNIGAGEARVDAYEFLRALIKGFR
jgi:hypothetical protein